MPLPERLTAPFADAEESDVKSCYVSPVAGENPHIVYLTAGAGGMFCGSCLRDNALAASLKAEEGMDVTLVPLYTPIRTDEADVSIDRVFFGGINVYLQQKLPFLRWLPSVFDRWLDNPKLIRRMTSKSMNVNARDLGALTLSMVQGEHGRQRKEVRKLVHWLRDEEKPDLICLTNLLIGGSIPSLKRDLPGVPILVTLQGDDLFLDELTEPWREKVIAEMKHLAAGADGFIVFNEFYRDRMTALLEIPEEKFHLTALGLDAADFDEIAAEAAPEHPPTVGYFARQSPEKGFDLAVDAFIDLAQRPGMETVRFKAGGWLSEKDRAFYDRQITKIDSTGLSDRFKPVGSVERDGKIEFFRDVDVFTVPARYVEPKGLYALEAMACGIPVVQPDHGAFPDMIESSSGGRLFPKGDTKALADGLARLIEDPETRRELGNCGREWVRRECSREAMARTTAEVFRKFLGP